MSMNLAFTTRSGNYVDFPFQTPTDLSYAVINLRTKKAKLELIENYMINRGWEKEYIFETMEKIKFLMNDKALILTVI